MIKSIFPSKEILEVQIESCWRAIFPTLPKKKYNQDWEWVLEEIGTPVQYLFFVACSASSAQPPLWFSLFILLLSNIGICVQLTF